MASVYDIIKQSGRIPLNELALRSSESSERVVESVRELKSLDLVRVNGSLPETGESVPDADAVVELPEFSSS